MNIPFAADIVNFVIILALFSSINSGYTPLLAFYIFA